MKMEWYGYVLVLLFLGHEASWSVLEQWPWTEFPESSQDQYSSRRERSEV